MSSDNSIMTVYCLIDNLLKNVMGYQKLHQRGFQTGLSDSEMIMMETVAELLETAVRSGMQKIRSKKFMKCLKST